VTVDKEQAVASASAQGKEVAEQDAAVTAEDDREEASGEDLADRVSQPDGVLRDAARIDDCGVTVPPRVMRRRFDPADLHRPQAVPQTGAKQGCGQVLHAGGAQPEHRRRLDDRKLSHP
jgi:hypothetical protein